MVTLISAYRVNPGSTSLGEYSTYKQQYHLLLQQNQVNPEPRSQCIIDLELFIQQIQENNEEIIQCIDANETISSHQTHQAHSITTLKLNLGLVNMAEYVNYKGRQIDFCFISPVLLSSVKSFRYLPYDSITSTDHKLYCLDFEILSFFDHSPVGAAPLETRIL